MPNRVFLAPMSGVTDLPFRERAALHGAGLVVSEMVASAELCRGDAESLQRGMFGDFVGVRVMQLAGREAQWIGEAARIAVDQGAQIVDINMGCPAKKVTGGLSGSALMRDLDQALTLIDATVAAVNVPVTLKMRLGWDEKSINAPELARRAHEAGIEMITVHGRTREQMYEGEADWAAIAAVRDATDLPLVVNGDIHGLNDAHKARALCGADAVMVGRACYGRPWLVGQIAGQDDTSIPCDGYALAAYIIDHYDAMLAHYGTHKGVRHARKHLGWYFDTHVDASAAMNISKASLMRETDADSVRALIKACFGSLGALANNLDMRKAA